MNREPGYPQEDNNEDEDFQPLSAQAARRIEQSSPRVSPLRLLAWQLGAVAVLAALAWLVARTGGAVWSVVYGGLAVMLPAVLFMKGMVMVREAGGRDAGFALVLFMVCEFGKLIFAAVMLFLAPRFLGDQLNWIALLASVVVTLKTYWVALWAQLKTYNRTIVEKS
ncbi:MAG: ATP synthase subunit I [Comamonas sp.]